MYGDEHKVKLLLSLISLAATLSMLVPTSLLAQNDFKVFVTGGNSIHELDLKATEGANSQIIPVSGFTIEADSVVQVKQNENLQVFTSTNEPERIDNVKVTTSSGQLIELIQVGTGWSLQGFATGVYLLDVIVDIPDGSKGAYETVLVILAPNEQNKDTNQVTKQVVKVDTQIVFKDKDEDKPKDKDKKPDLRKICTFNPSDPRCKPDPKKGCPPGFGTNENGQCFWRGDCPDGYHRANDDETGRCVPDRDLKQCEDGSWAYKDDDCPEDWPQPIDCPDGSTVLEGEPCPEPVVDDEILPPCSLVAAGETCDNTEDEDSWTDEEVEEEDNSDVEDEPEEEESSDEDNNDNDESFEDEEAAAEDEDS